MADSWFNTTDQYNIFKASLDRSQLIFKMAQAQRMEAELAKLNDKYDGKKAAGIEEQINSIANRKYDVTNYLTNVQSGLKRIDDIRTQLLMAKDAISKGSNDAFDLALNSINLWIGRQKDDPDSVIANNTNGRGGWSKDVTVVAEGSQSVELSHQFLGTDYAVVLNNGSVLRPDKTGTKLSGTVDGATVFKDLEMTRLASLTDAGGVTSSGTFKVNEVTTLRDGSGNPVSGADGNPIQGTVTTAAGVTTFTATNGKTYTVTSDSNGTTLTDDSDNTQTFSGSLSTVKTGKLVDSGGATMLDADGNPIEGAITTVAGRTTLTDANGKTYSMAYSDQVRVTATVTDDDGNTTVTTYDGTLRTGGLGVMHAWGYGDFSDADPETRATARQAATADIDAAFRKLAQMERNLNMYDAGLSGISNSLDGKSSTLATEYRKVSEEELDAKQAERRAIEQRFNIATNAMALSNETTATLIYQMFVKSPTYEKQSLSDALLGAAGY